MTYTLINITGENLEEVYSLKIGLTYYSLVGPYLNTGDFTTSLSGTQDTCFTKLNSGTSTFLSIFSPPIHRNGEKLLLISNDQILDLGPLDFASVTPVVSNVIRNPHFIGNVVKISGRNLLGIENVIFGNDAYASSFTFSPDGKSIDDCIVPDDAGSGFLQVVNFSNKTGKSEIPFFPFPRIDSLESFTGVIDGPVTIIGKSFNHVTGVRFNSVLSKSFTVDSNYQITAIVPSGNVNGRISVSGHTGTFDVSDFFFEAIPIITGQFPLTGKRDGATRLLMTGVIPEILFAAQTGVGIPSTGYLVEFKGTNATGLFYLSGASLTGIVPSGARKGLVNIIRDGDLSVYPSNYSFNLSGIKPFIDLVDPITGRYGFSVYGEEFFTITGFALKHVDSNKIYDLPTGNNVGFRIIEIDGADNIFQIRVRGLTGLFEERTTTSSKYLEEGKYNIILTDENNVANIFAAPNENFYFATKPYVSGFSPTSGYLTSTINFYGTGLYPGTTVRFDVTGKRTTLADSSITGENNRSGLFNLNDNRLALRENLFPSDEDPKELVTGFLYFENDFYSDDYATGNGTGVVPFTILGPPYLSGFSPLVPSVGQTVILSGLGFRDILTIKLRRNDYPITSFNVVSTTGINFLITEDIYNNSKGGGFIDITASGGSATSSAEILLKGVLPVASGFAPQPAPQFIETIITGSDLKSVNLLTFVATTVNETVTLGLDESLSNTTFITGSGLGTGFFLKFLSPQDVQNNEFVQLTTVDGIDFNSLTRFRNLSSTLFIISGYSDGAIVHNAFTGVVGSVFGIAGSGFNSSNAKIVFGTGDVTLDLFKPAASSAVISNFLITGALEPGMNGNVFVSGSLNNEIQFSSVDGLVLIPQISGVRSTTMTEDDIFVISGINNLNFSGDDIPLGNLEARLASYIRLGITGFRYGGTSGIVEYINYDVSGFKVSNAGLLFSGRINSEFAGTGRLFLIGIEDALSIGANPRLEGEAEQYDFLNIIYNSGFFSLDGTPGQTSSTVGFTKDYLSDALKSFNQTVTINEKQATISGFYPPKGRSESNVFLTGNSLKAVTGIAIFSGSNVSSSSVPFGYESLYALPAEDETDPPVSFFGPPNYGRLSFTIPASYTQSSGKLRLFSKNHSTDSVDFFKIISQINASAISPTGGVAGDLITLNGQAFSKVNEVRFVNLDGEFATGAFSIIDDIQMTVTVPDEGRLPAPQIVSINVTQDEGEINLGNFEVRQGSEKFFGNIQATGFISGSNFLGTGAGGRPTVNGSGVLLVGEAAAGGGGGINVTGGIDTDSASQIFTGNGTQSLFGLNSGIHTGIKGSTQQIRSASVLVSIDGLMQNPVEHYTIVDPLGGVKYSGLQFASVPFSGSDIEVRRFGDTVTIEITGLGSGSGSGGITANQAIIYALVLG